MADTAYDSDRIRPAVVATRFEKTAANYLAVITIAAVVLWR